MMIEELFDAHGAGLKRFALSLTREGDEADDLVQETFLRALAHVELLRMLPPAKRRAWLYTVLRNCLVDRRRRQKFESPIGGDEESETAFESAVESSPLAQADLATAVGSLPLKLRDTVVKRYWLGMTSAEIARDLGIPAATIRFRLHTAIGILKTTLHHPPEEAV